MITYMHHVPHQTRWGASVWIWSDDRVESLARSKCWFSFFGLVTGGDASAREFSTAVTSAYEWMIWSDKTYNAIRADDACVCAFFQPVLRGGVAVRSGCWCCVCVVCVTIMICGAWCCANLYILHDPRTIECLRRAARCKTTLALFTITRMPNRLWCCSCGIA